MLVLALAVAVLYIASLIPVLLVVKFHILQVLHILELIAIQVGLLIIAAMAYRELVECGQKFVGTQTTMDIKFIHQFMGLKLQLNVAKLGQVDLAVQDAALLVAGS
jgi:hypothetical protein